MRNIGDYAFSGCNGLTSVTIPDSVRNIGYGAFCCCYGLTSVTIPDSVRNIGGRAFEHCGELTSIEIPDGVRVIGEKAFQECGKLTSVSIGDSVTDIEERAFDNCYNLTSVKFGNSIVSIGNEAFVGCPITEVAFGDSLQSIGKAAFRGCYRLTSVIIPDSVIEIGEDAFTFCSMMSVTIGNSVQSIGKGAFSYDRELLQISFGQNISITPNQNSFPDHTFYAEDGTTLVGSSVSDFRGYTFKGTSQDKMIRSVTGPEHTVCYDLGGGIGKTPASDNVPEGCDFILKDCDGIKDGLFFGGWLWNDNVYKSGTKVTMGDSDMIMTAIYVTEEELVSEESSKDDDSLLQFRDLIFIGIVVVIALAGMAVVLKRM